MTGVPVNKSHAIVVAIDGAAGTGKSSIAKKIATSLDWDYLETGALYRGVALLMEREGKDYSNVHLASSFAMKMKFDSRFTSLGWKNFINGQDVTDLLRQEKISELASLISADTSLRTVLLDYQRKYGKEKGAVLEGRDIGTVVFPNAEYKFFLVADTEVRAKRRLLEMRDMGEKKSLADIISDIEFRDRFDRTRDHSPLVKADDALSIDTSLLTVDEQINKIVGIINKQ